MLTLTFLSWPRLYQLATVSFYERFRFLLIPLNPRKNYKMTNFTKESEDSDNLFSNGHKLFGVFVNILKKILESGKCISYIFLVQQLLVFIRFSIFRQILLWKKKKPLPPSDFNTNIRKIHSRIHTIIHRNIGTYLQTYV